MRSTRRRTASCSASTSRRCAAGWWPRPGGRRTLTSAFQTPGVTRHAASVSQDRNSSFFFLVRGGVVACHTADGTHPPMLGVSDTVPRYLEFAERKRETALFPFGFPTSTQRLLAHDLRFARNCTTGGPFALNFWRDGHFMWCKS